MTILGADVGEKRGVGEKGEKVEDEGSARRVEETLPPGHHLLSRVRENCVEQTRLPCLSCSAEPSL